MLFGNFSIVHLLGLFIVAYTIIFWGFNLDNKSRLMTYMSDLGMFVAFFGFILSQLEEIRQRQQEELASFNQQQEAAFIEIEKLFMKYYPELFHLYKELNSQNKHLQSLPDPTNIDPNKRAQFESNMFNIIIQRIENVFIAYNNYEEFSKSPWFEEWMQTWKHWFLSPTMQRLWAFNKNIFFDKRTVNFVDMYLIPKTTQNQRHSLQKQPIPGQQIPRQPIPEQMMNSIQIGGFIKFGNPYSKTPIRRALLSKGTTPYF